MRRGRAAALVIVLIAVLAIASLVAAGVQQAYLPLVMRLQASQTPTESQVSPTPTQTIVSPTPTEEEAPPTQPAASPTPTQGMAIEPYPDAPLCPDTGDLHDNGQFHTLWDGARGCHYDHEHGQYPFTPDVVAAFPGFDLRALIGGVEVGHTNPSSEMENTHKHGGMKWNVILSHSTGCAGREGVSTGVDAMVIQYHAFGNYSIEFETRIHSAVALMRQCPASKQNDYGYIFANQHQDYGQRVAPYQGSILQYPDTPLPSYNSGREPYFSVDCFGASPPCNKYPDLQYVLSRNANADSTWISEPVNLDGSGSPLFGLLFRVRDTYQMINWTDQTYPFTFAWLCSSDGGASYSQAPGCRYNNSTTMVHEVFGSIPAAWDNLAGFDSDPREGRVTAEGFVTRFGDLNPDCTEPGPDCHPLKLVQAFTGRYGALFRISAERNSFDPLNLPERDIYFCGEQVCAEGDPGAVPSGWIGQNN